MKYYNYLNSNIGTLYMVFDETYLYVLSLHKECIQDYEYEDTNISDEVKKQLNEYFNKERENFTIPLKLEGTVFQKQVWDALCKIPYGETRSYEDMAKMIHKDKACRAIGNANHKNPIIIIVPCHRVINKNGGLGGYGGGIQNKQYLLDLETKNV